MLRTYKNRVIKNIIGLAAVLILSAAGLIAVQADTETGESEIHTETHTEAEQTLPPVLSVEEADGAISCMEGQQPAPSEYPSVVTVTYKSPQEQILKKELPVQWDTGSVNFSRAGSYKVEGTLSEETLRQNALTNPAKLKASLTVLVQKKENINSLEAAGIAIEADGKTTVRLRMPVLPFEAEALYVYSSTDGKYWRRMYANRTTGQAASAGGNYDFSKSCVSAPPYQYVICRYMTDYRPVMFRVEVRGSALEGTSNAVRFNEPATAVRGEALDKWNGDKVIEEDDRPVSHHKSGSFVSTSEQKNAPGGPPVLNNASGNSGGASAGGSGAGGNGGGSGSSGGRNGSGSSGGGSAAGGNGGGTTGRLSTDIQVQGTAAYTQPAASGAQDIDIDGKERETAAPEEFPAGEGGVQAGTEILTDENGQPVGAETGAGAVAETGAGNPGNRTVAMLLTLALLIGAVALVLSKHKKKRES